MTKSNKIRKATCELLFEKYRYPTSSRIIAECSICLEGITTVKETKLRCGHPFHDTCIMRWLREHNRCPMCRAGI
ncbi:hypothetical protein pipiens_011653 [Culex pipiens pipiens]|uniref:RING-type domain-containing protein n=1 Tax=Culex pipiens pipiens TaxID=38569 RepID=A0ABD1D5F2_CULPP